jgi:hypothetical protein
MYAIYEVLMKSSLNRLISVIFALRHFVDLEDQLFRGIEKNWCGTITAILHHELILAR